MLLVLTIAVFLYRWWVLQSIGGYQSATGGPAILHFSMLRTMKALFFREWGLLFFPLNWSIAPSALEITAILGILVVMAMALLVSKPDKRRLLAALGFVIAISIPVQHLLLISADLNGSRVLYLPVLGFALFWAVLVDGCGNLRIQQTVVVMLVLCHFLLLNHNLNIWSRVADLSRNTCLELGKRLSSDEQPVLVRNLPVKQDGVYFLRNGFPQCVFATSGISPNRIQVDDTQPAVPGERIFVWDESCGKLEERVSQISPSQ